MDIAAFRGFTAAASLKQRGQLDFVGLAVGFPRFHRRGLIEAAAAAPDRTLRPEAFRGFTAAASLKRLQRDHLGLRKYRLSAVSPPRPH